MIISNLIRWARLRLKIRRMDAPCRREHTALVFEKPELLQASESPEPQLYLDNLQKDVRARR